MHIPVPGICTHVYTQPTVDRCTCLIPWTSSFAGTKNFKNFRSVTVEMFYLNRYQVASKRKKLRENIQFTILNLAIMSRDNVRDNVLNNVLLPPSSFLLPPFHNFLFLSFFHDRLHLPFIQRDIMRVDLPLPSHPIHVNL